MNAFTLQNTNEQMPPEIRKMIWVLDNFDKNTEAEEHTDSEDAWNMLYYIRRTMEEYFEEEIEYPFKRKYPIV